MANEFFFHDFSSTYIHFGSWYHAQRRQNARLFPNWDSPTLHPQASVSPPLWLRAGDTLADGRGCGGSQFGRGDRHCGTLGIYVYVLCGTMSSIEIDTIEYQQKEKIETEVSDDDRIRAYRCTQLCPGSPSGASHSHNIIYYSIPADSPPQERKLPDGEVCTG
jgi:hypothetical protein